MFPDQVLFFNIRLLDKFQGIHILKVKSLCCLQDQTVQQQNSTLYYTRVSIIIKLMEYL